MTYLIQQRLLRNEFQERMPLQATRLVVHSTANPGVGDESHFSWLDSARQPGWAHYYLDWNSISQVAPEGFVAPAQGPHANRDSISFEICEAVTADQFQQAWDRAVWLAADILSRYGWRVDRLFSHADISRLYPQDTDHTDPIGYFAKWGKTWPQFQANVSAALAARSTYPAAETWQEDCVTQLMNAGMLHQRRPANQPVLWWELATQNLKLLELMHQKG